MKLAGKVSVNELTGRITTSFEDSPQVPLEELSLHFFEGPHATLSTPSWCGTYTTTATFTAWSGAVQGRGSARTVHRHLGAGWRPVSVRLASVLDVVRRRGAQRPSRCVFALHSHDRQP